MFSCFFRSKNHSPESLDKQLILEKFAPWSSLKESDIEINRLSGITNVTYSVQVLQKPDVVPQRIIYRRFGQSFIGCLLKRELENEIMVELAGAGLAPEVYGATKEWRIERFLDADVMRTEQMSEAPIARRLMKTLATLHVFKSDKTPQESLLEKLYTTKEWVKAFQKKVAMTQFKEEDASKIVEICSVLSDSEIDWFMAKVPTGNPLAFSHNDCLNGNIMIDRKTGQLSLIDFEYFGKNLRCFDIANFLAERMIDYSVKTEPFFRIDTEKFPAIEEVTDLIRHYILHSFILKNKPELVLDIEKLAGGDQEYFKEVREAVVGEEEFEKEVEEMLKEYPVCMMLCNHLWMMWGIIMFGGKDVNISYVDFAFGRYTEYKRVKKLFFPSN